MALDNLHHSTIRPCSFTHIDWSYQNKVQLLTFILRNTTLRYDVAVDSAGVAVVADRGNNRYAVVLIGQSNPLCCTQSETGALLKLGRSLTPPHPRVDLISLDSLSAALCSPLSVRRWLGQE